MDMSTLGTQEFVYTWLVQIFMKSKALTFDSEISVVDSVVKPRQVDGVGAVIAVPPFEFVFLPSSSPSGFVLSSSPRLPRLVSFCLPPLVFLVLFRYISHPTAPRLSVSFHVCSPRTFFYGCLGCRLQC
jgi:hypothetical protein